MPMDFPDMKSLVSAAELWRFRTVEEGETEDEYRIALADFVAPKDYVESCEIRNKVGWDRFSAKQNQEMVWRMPASRFGNSVPRASDSANASF